MATKNRIVHRLWIIQITTIPRDKISKQNCLRFLYQERVGMMSKGKDNYSEKEIEKTLKKKFFEVFVFAKDGVKTLKTRTF